MNTAQYVDVLDSRIQALARAHDQITAQRWSAASFRQLVHIEAESYLQHKGDRVIIEGEDCLLEPNAYSTVALVIHELMTNSAKYGALCGQSGQVNVVLAKGAQGELVIKWTETGGPPVNEPERRGFGSTIIERSIPYELAGKSSIDYQPDGVVAVLEVPEQFVVDAEAKEIAPDMSRQTSVELGTWIPNNVLVVEDNMIIAMEAENLFHEIGSKSVHIAANVKQAEASMSTKAFDFALLDVNLGSETSFGLAEMLRSRGTKIAFASGYGEGGQYPEALADVRRMSKPYDSDALYRLLAAVESDQ